MTQANENTSKVIDREEQRRNTINNWNKEKKRILERYEEHKKSKARIEDLKHGQELKQSIEAQTPAVENTSNVIDREEQIRNTKNNWNNQKKRFFEQHEELKKSKAKIEDSKYGKELRQSLKTQTPDVSNEEIEEWVLEFAKEIEQSLKTQTPAISNEEIGEWVLEFAKEIEQTLDVQTQVLIGEKHIYEIPAFDDCDDGVGDDNYYTEDIDNQNVILKDKLPAPNVVIEKKTIMLLNKSESEESSDSPISESESDWSSDSPISESESSNIPHDFSNSARDDEEALVTGDDLDTPTVGFTEVIKGTNKEFKDFIVKYKSTPNFSLDFLNSVGNPLLFIAASSSSTGKIKILIEHGANINVKNDKGENLLGYMANHSMSFSPWVKFALNMLPYLVEHGIDTKNVNSEGESFTEALNNNKNLSLDLKESFISRLEGVGKSIVAKENLITQFDLKDLAELGTMEFTDLLKTSLSDPAFNINSLDEAGNPMLFNVIGESSLGKVQMLLHNKADINIKNSNGENLLSFIIKHKTTSSTCDSMLKVIKLLISKKIETNAINSEGHSLLEELNELNNLSQGNKDKFIFNIKKSIEASQAIKSDVSSSILDEDTNSKFISSMSDNKPLTSKNNDSLNEKFNSTTTNDNALNPSGNDKDMMEDNMETMLAGTHSALEEC